MKLSYNWLKEYIPLNISAENLADRLTMAGLEIKGADKTNGDTVFELEITPNRADCLSHLGVVREISALTLKSVKFPPVAQIKKLKSKPNITILDKKACSRYIGVVIKNISIAQTPSEIKKFLSSVGLRSINNIVDITNFSLLENGQPLHVFDYDKLKGNQIIVRRAKDKEKIVTIDGVTRELNPSILIIADSEKPVAIAGIMGGRDTEVTLDTKNILLESAYFDPIVIRQASRSLGLTSDSAYRFERSVNPEGVLFGAKRAIHLTFQHAGGSLESFADINLLKSAQKKITISKDKIDSVLGMNVPDIQIKKMLSALGFKVAAKGNSFTIGVPVFRRDVTSDVDIIEEITRIYGYNKIKTQFPSVNSIQLINEKIVFKVRVAESLVAQGLTQVINYTLINEDYLKNSHLSVEALKVRNPLSQDQAIMRPSLLPSLLNSVAANLNKGEKNLKLFELGKIYLPSSFEGVLEKECMGLVLTGKQNTWRHTKEDVDFYDLKGIIENTFEALGITESQFVPSEESFFEKGACAHILVNHKKAGIVGIVAQDVLRKWNIKQKNVLFAQIDLELEITPKSLYYKQISQFPAISRDVSLAVKENITFEKIRDLALHLKSEFLTDIKFLELYLGEKIPKGYRGITISLIYQSPARTLREEEVDQIHNQFVSKVVEDFEAIRR